MTAPITPNKSDAANPAMALWLTIEDQWRRVADLERSTRQHVVAANSDAHIRYGSSHRFREAHRLLTWQPHGGFPRDGCSRRSSVGVLNPWEEKGRVWGRGIATDQMDPSHRAWIGSVTPRVWRRDSRRCACTTEESRTSRSTEGALSPSAAGSIAIPSPLLGDLWRSVTRVC